MTSNLRFEQFEHWVPFPVDKVFAFFSNPENLSRIMPPASATRLTGIERRPAPPCPTGSLGSSAAGVGTRIVTSFRPVPWLPLRATWVSRIVEFEWNHHFADIQEKGPFRSWRHRHRFAAESRDGIAGTTVRDEIEYDAGFGFLGTIPDALFIRRGIAATVAARQRALPQLLERG